MISLNFDFEKYNSYYAIRSQQLMNESVFKSLIKKSENFLTKFRFKLKIKNSIVKNKIVVKEIN
jgi:hypothetical protein